MRARVAAGLLAVATSLGMGCAPHGLAFRVDTRVSITAPGDRHTVTLPLTIAWKVEHFEIAEPGTPLRSGAGYFAVFVDRTPMAPGKSLESITRGDSECRTTPACPDAPYFERLGIYPTTATEVVVREVRAGATRTRDRHRATIVLLDSSGRRTGESAFEVEFDVTRPEEAG